MTILRGTKNLNGYPPGLYINEMAVPNSDDVKQSDFILGFVGDFDRGPINQYVMISETPTKRLIEIAASTLGLKTNSKKGNALLDHLDRAKIKRAVFVRILGAGYATASATLKDRQTTPVDTIRIKPKAGPGTYANVFSYKVEEGTNANTFKLTLVSDIGGIETYDNLSMDPNNALYAINTVNNKSEHFILENLSVSTDYVIARPAVKTTTQLTGGLNGAALTESDYIGTFNTGTGARTGLKLLEVVGNILTDVAYADFTSALTDVALLDFGRKYNCFAYTGCGTATTIAAAVTYRNTFDNDFGQMVYGRYKSVGDQFTSGACLSAIAHVLGNIEDSGIAVEMSWLTSAEQDLPADDYTTCYTNQISAFQLKPSSKGDGSLAYRLSNDYTLAKTDVDGSVIGDDENRKVNKRRLNSWIEKSLEAVAAPWQGKAMTKKMRNDAERRIRTYFDNLVKPTNELETSKIETYSIAFDEKATSIDQFVQNIKVKHYNTAEWILLNYQGGTNVEVTN